jgi:hypothetical protein
MGRSYIAYRQDRDNAITDQFGQDSYPLIWTLRVVVPDDQEPGLWLLGKVLEDSDLPAGHYTFAPESELISMSFVLDGEITHRGGREAGI